ncbi:MULTISPECIES: acyltransferase [unclassified Escherichia]|uniref:acyltransferase n=1 Tax=unclassified Escherichia TaxID=2608889 RepID=UPI001029FA68|nr:MULTISPECIES: acyltransferase [unclassified Escherichia]RZN20145.1 acyltransferase [Escherichia sp. E14S1]TLI71860.1 acyltransferase [Escherichia sp. E1130]
MSFLSDLELKELGFKKIGKNVKISSKASIYNSENIEIGDNSRIDDFCLLSGKVTVGKNVHIAAFCNIAGGIEGVTLGDFSGLAYGCHVFSQSDDYTGRTMTNPTIPKKFKKEIIKQVVIGKHVIIGTNSLVFPGVTIEEGCSVGAMTMVTKSTKPWGCYFGIPAKRIKERKKDLLELELLFNKESNNSKQSQ